ncbi:MAG: hypothetical protein HRT89_21210, partial [Lentisphaeria bacterium]|nr:hypothetical protein [Lentisphaeria bacterium]
NKLIKEQRIEGKELIQSAMDDIRNVLFESKLLSWGTAQLAAKAFKKYYGNSEYYAELESFAEAWDISLTDLITANLTYELSQLGESISAYACTSLARYVKGLGWVHGRNLDWNLDGLGDKSLILKFIGPAGEFKSLSWPGYIGVLQGVAAGRFSASINYAPTTGVKNGIPPSFLLREVFANCHTFEEAVDTIVNAKTAASAFFILCGTKRHEAVVIEKSLHHAVTRYAENDCLIQTNNYVLLDDEYDYRDCDRFSYASKALPRIKIRKATDLFNKVLSTEPVFNENTVAQNIFVPRSGRIISYIP